MGERKSSTQSSTHPLSLRPHAHSEPPSEPEDGIRFPLTERMAVLMLKAMDAWRPRVGLGFYTLGDTCFFYIAPWDWRNVKGKRNHVPNKRRAVILASKKVCDNLGAA